MPGADNADVLIFFKTRADVPISGFICKEEIEKPRFFRKTQGIDVSKAVPAWGIANPPDIPAADRHDYNVVPEKHRLINFRPSPEF